MSQSKDQFFQNLLQNITDYYTATYSSDTDLYQILQMYSAEFASGSISANTIKDNTFIVTCEDSKLFSNFGSFFDVPKAPDQSFTEDRYLPNASGFVTFTTPTVIDYKEEFTAPGTWARFPTWPFNSDLALTTLQGTTQREGVFWSGSLYSTCFMDRPIASGSAGDYIQLAQYTPTLGWEIFRTFTDSTWIDTNDQATIPFGLTVYKPYKGRGIYDPNEYMSYYWISQRTPIIGTPLFGSQIETEPSSNIDRLQLFIFPPTYQNNSPLDYNHTTNNNGQLVTVNLWFQEGARSSTKGVVFNDKVYAGLGARASNYWQFNANRRAANLEAYPQYSNDDTRTYPYLLEYDPKTNTVLNAGFTAQTTLTAYVNSGSWGSAPPHTIGATEADWSVNAIGLHGNRLYLDMTSGSINSVASTRRHKFSAYNGVDWAFDLTPPSGSRMIDMHTYKDHLYATVQDDEAPKYRIAKYIHGLETLPTTVGHWKFEQTLNDTSTSNHNLSTNTIVSNDYTKGFTGPGITSINARTKIQDAFIPAATASDFDPGTGNMTIEAVVRIPKTGPLNNIGIVNKWDSSVNEGWSLGITGSEDKLQTGKVFVRVGEEGGTNITLTGSTQINDDKWHLITYVIRANGLSATLTIYIDSIQDATITPIFHNLAQIRATTADLEIMSTSADNPFVGLLDEICISTIELLEGDIIWRNYQVSHQDGSWITEKVFTQPINQLFVYNNYLMTSIYVGDIYYLNSNTWELLQSTQSTNEPIIKFISSEDTIWGMAPDYWQSGTDLFKTVPYEYFYGGATNTQIGLQPTSIPSYKTQLNFLFKGAMQGSTVAGIQNAVQGFTLINPDIREIAPLPSWKLKTFSGSVAQISENIWQFNDYYIHGLSTLPQTIGHYKLIENAELVQRASTLYNYYGLGIFLDISGNSNHLSDKNSTLVSTDFVDGYTELAGTHTAVSFATNKVLTIPATDAIDFDMDQNNFTIEAIVKITSTPSVSNALLGKGIFGNGTTTGGGWYFEISTSGKITAVLLDGVTNTIFNSTTNIISSSWRYFVATIDRTNNQLKLYLDGILDSTHDISTLTSNISKSTESFNIGTTLDAGLIDEVTVSKNVALNAAQINSRWVSIQTSYNILRSGQKIRTRVWDGAHATFTSGSHIPNTQITAGYLINTTSGNKQITVAPIYNSELLWDLKRLL